MKQNLAFNPQEYDKKIRQTLPYYEEFYRQVVDVVKTVKSQTQLLNWLDVGCGTGKMASVAYEEFLLDKFVFCDPSEEMISIAKSRFSKKNTAEFSVESIQGLNYQNEFDVITAIQVNHYLTRVERMSALKRYYNALKENGVYISFENFAPYTEKGKEIYLKRWKAYQHENGKSIEECDKHIARYNTGYFPITINEHISFMNECGFRTAEVLWVSNMQVGLLGMK